MPLTQKAFEVLLALVERRGGLVSKEELMAKVWPDTIVEESNLTQNIYTLRKALGQTPDGEGYIVTVPRRGYRFAAGVRELTEEEESQSEPAPIKFDINLAAKSDAARGAAPAPALIKESGEVLTVSEVAIGKRSPAVRPSPRTLKVLSAAVLVIAAAGVAWFIIQKNRSANPPRNMSVAALTAAGNVLTAALSPDGAYVAYATSENADRSGLWLEQLSTSSGGNGAARWHGSITRATW